MVEPHIQHDFTAFKEVTSKINLKLDSEVVQELLGKYRQHEILGILVSQLSESLARETLRSRFNNK